MGPLPEDEAPSAPGPPAPSPKAWWRQPGVWAGFAVSALAVATLAWVFDFEQVLASVRQVHPVPVLLSTGAFLCAFALRALRWQLLLRPVRLVSYGQARDVLMTGYMINNVLPARLGELARALALWKVTGASRRATLATIGVERLVDGVVLIAMLSLLGLTFTVPEWVGRLSRAAGVVVAVAVALTAWLAYHHRSLFWVMERALFFIPKRQRHRLVVFLTRFVEGTGALRRPLLTAAVILSTVSVWAFEVLVYTAMMRGFAIDLPAWAAAVTVVVTNIGISVPSAPGHVGVWEAACSGALVGLGLNKERALSFALGLHLMMYICVTGIGVALMWRQGLKLTEVTGRSGPAGRATAA